MPTIPKDKKPLSSGLNKAQEAAFFSRVISDKDIRNSENLDAHLASETSNEMMLYRAI